MLGGLAIILIGWGIANGVIRYYKAKFPFIDVSLLRKLYGYHVLLTAVYFIYTLFFPSDSRAYYYKVLMNYRGEDWLDFYGTSTVFIEFVGYPLIKYFFFSFEAVMAFFSLLGYFGFLYFYLFFKEHVKFKHYLFGYNLIYIIFFLPNLHFWSSSFGKGSVILLGISLFFFGLGNIRSRYIAVLIGGLIIYHVRPHVMLVILISTALGFIFSTRGVSFTWRLIFLFSAMIGFFLIYADTLKMVGLDQEELIAQGLDLSHRATELAKAGSGVDISSYSLPMQLFTFLYRPLFFDAPGILGIIVSFENVLYLILTLKLISSWRGIKFIFSGDFLVKSAFFSFFTVSLALAQIAGNLGLAIRQKSQVMLLLLFVLLAFLDSQKMQRFQLLRKKRLRIMKQQQLVKT